ncbi:FAD-dependent oxidoreductase [Chloroflexota bacterium]
MVYDRLTGVERQALIDKEGCLSWRVDLPPCQAACPLGIDVEGYVAAISQGNFGRALEIIRERCPLPGICGYVCHHPCEAECKRGTIDEPIAIRDLKRFVADYENGEKFSPKAIEKTRPEKIAIIGSGPAGLTAAYGLAKYGYQVTIYEALPIAGGMLAAGIPEFDLPQQVVQKEISYIRALGIEIKTNSPVKGDEAITDLLKQGYEAVVLAIGAWKSMQLPRFEAKLEGVIYALPFLQKVKLGEKCSLQGKGVIIGGGNVAIDAARTALRLGAKEVHLVCIESRENMPAFEWVIRLAITEGVNIHTSLFPQELHSKDGRKISRLDLRRVAYSELDDDGRLTWTLDEGLNSESSMELDWMIIAIGQKVDLSVIGNTGQFCVSQKGTIAVDPDTLTTSVAGIFAAGDIVNIRGTIVEAMAAGWKASDSVHRYLQGQDLRQGPATVPKSAVTGADMLPLGIATAERQQTSLLPPMESIQNFKKVELTFSKEQAVQEAMRCLRCKTCGRCIESTNCIALFFTQNASQVSPCVDSNLCAGCGRCARSCPYNGIHLVAI